jgi:hypothetical protein
LENNDFSHGSDGPYINGKWTILRKNLMHDISGQDCNSANSGNNCHIDFMQSDTSGGSSSGPILYVLLEGNTVTNMVSAGPVSGSGTHSIGLFQDNSCGSNCGYGILRFHKVSHIDGGGLFDNTNNWGYLKTYHTQPKRRNVQHVQYRAERLKPQ